MAYDKRDLTVRYSEIRTSHSPWKTVLNKNNYRFIIVLYYYRFVVTNRRISRAHYALTHHRYYIIWFSTITIYYYKCIWFMHIMIINNHFIPRCRIMVTEWLYVYTIFYCFTGNNNVIIIIYTIKLEANVAAAYKLIKSLYKMCIALSSNKILYII